MLVRTGAAQGDFYAPVSYSIWWPILGTALILLCLGWVGWVWLSTRASNQADIPGFIPLRTPATIQREYLALIDSVQTGYDAGRLGERESHRELSAAVRSFVFEMTGIKAAHMTLAELRQRQLPLVAEAVAGFYPGEFAPNINTGPDGQAYVGASANAARTVVATWN